MAKAVSYFRFSLLVLMSNCVLGQKTQITLNIDSSCNTENSLKYFHHLDSLDSSIIYSASDSMQVLYKFEKCILKDKTISMMAATSMEVDGWIYNFAISSNQFFDKIDSFPDIATQITYYIGNEIANLVENNAIKFLIDYKPIANKFALKYLNSKNISENEYDFTLNWYNTLNK